MSRTRDFVSRQLASVQQAAPDAEGRAEAIDRLTKELASFPPEDLGHDRSDPCVSCREELDQARADLAETVRARDEWKDLATTRAQELVDLRAAAKAKPAAKPVAKARAKR